MRTLIVEADGASRGNPGEASYGAVVRDAETGELLAELAVALGRATNNAAEYRGLIAGLEAARAVDPRARVEVRMDSKLVVEQLSGRWQVKHPDLKPLAARARELFPASGEIAFTWIPRGQNQHADGLANEALDAVARGEVWTSKTVSGGGASGQSSAASVSGPASAPASAQPSTSRPPAAGWAADLGTPTRLLLLRHGVTPLTGEKRFSGLGDPDLTEQGRAQAAAAARRLASPGFAFGPVHAVVHSPLRRTRQTAEASAALLGLDPVAEDGLRELDFGRFEGLSFAEAREKFPAELAAFLASPDTPAPGGESVRQTAARAGLARDRLLERHPRRTVLAVTHVTPIKALVCEALGAPLEAVNRMELGAASLTVIDFYADGVANLRCLNDVSHLAAL